MIGNIYKKSDALLMPTLLESLGLPYLEAMNYKKSILTSKFDLAFDVVVILLITLIRWMSILY